jgi:hypothetical protein
MSAKSAYIWREGTRLAMSGNQELMALAWEYNTVAAGINGNDAQTLTAMILRRESKYENY